METKISLYICGMNERTIKNIIFDLGGVILNLDKQRCFNAFNELGIDLSRAGLGFYGQTGPLGDLEQGLVDELEFYNRFREAYKTNVSDAQIRDAWNRFLVDIPHERLSYLKELGRDYNLFLLSNTSIIHFEHWQKMFRYEPDKIGSEYFFKNVYCSYAMHLVKPDKRAFEYVLENENINPSETMFFDDSEANIQTARQLGMQCILVGEGEELVKIKIDKLI